MKSSVKKRAKVAVGLIIIGVGLSFWWLAPVIILSFISGYYFRGKDNV